MPEEPKPASTPNSTPIIPDPLKDPPPDKDKTPVPTGDPPQTVVAKPDDLSKNFLKLSRRVQNFEKLQAETVAKFEAREHSLADKEKMLDEYARKARDFDDLDSYFQKKDFVGLMKSRGVDFREVANQVIRDGSRDPAEMIQEAVARTKTEILSDLEKRNIADSQRQQRELEVQAEQRAKTDIAQLIRDYPEKWELVSTLSGPEEIYKVMDDVWKLTGGKKLLTFQEALDRKEKELTENAGKSKKLRTMLQPETPKEEPKPVVPVRPAPQTLSTRKPVVEAGANGTPALTNEQRLQKILADARAQQGR